MPEVRRFIRHPSELPLEFSDQTALVGGRRDLRDIGFGGLAFHCGRRIDPGTRLALRIPGLHPPAALPDAEVAWCRREEGGYAIGVRFADPCDAFLVRMVEQVCHIESYRRQVGEAGRRLSSEEAAMEWISRHAGDFPDP
ncbi:MAG TPA: PilZ domain-containing protein [Rhodocyclaceae bacterium]|nr:PilZ domain-containing protein [Rhodocyclaceae bacterium]HNH35258.1 PilZ domain-containing protein [Rhodocyclaceae bacterium]